MPASRPPPETCEICGLFPVWEGWGFPSAPGAVPGLPDQLRGACLWVCPGHACRVAAQSRALTAAAREGCTPARLWRHRHFPEPKE